MKKGSYEKQLRLLQLELVALQEWVKRTGERIVIVFEGRDAAGKGGMIRAITERVSPRVFRTVALPAPSDKERTQLYAQRYIECFPSAGEVVLFDRSWYNRAGVESVMGFCSPQEVDMFLANTPLFEKHIVASGIRLIKYWLDISVETQRERLQARINDPIKHWKLSSVDLESHKRWQAYTHARDRMLQATHTDEAPWYVVDSNDKRLARLNCIHHLLEQIPYQKPAELSIELPDAEVSGESELDLSDYAISTHYPFLD